MTETTARDDRPERAGTRRVTVVDRLRVVSALARRKRRALLALVAGFWIVSVVTSIVSTWLIMGVAPSSVDLARPAWLVGGYWSRLWDDHGLAWDPIAFGLSDGFLNVYGESSVMLNNQIWAWTLSLATLALTSLYALAGALLFLVLFATLKHRNTGTCAMSTGIVAGATLLATKGAGCCGGALIIPWLIASATGVLSTAGPQVMATAEDIAVAVYAIGLVVVAVLVFFFSGRLVRKEREVGLVSGEQVSSR